MEIQNIYKEVGAQKAGQGDWINIGGWYYNVILYMYSVIF